MKNRKPPLGLIIGSSILVGMMLAGFIVLQHSKKSRIQEWTKTEQLFLARGQDAANIQEIKKQRAAFFTRNLLLNHPSKLSFGVADFLRELSVISTGPVRIQTLDITPGQESFSFRLTGMIFASTQQEAEKKFSGMDEKLEGLENLIETFFDGVRINEDDEGKKVFMFDFKGVVGLE